MPTEASYQLTPERVGAVFQESLAPDGAEDAVLAEGAMSTATFDAERLNAHTKEIEQMLLELPEVYRESSGGGMCFTQACIDRHGNQWTGMQAVMEQLFQLGIAIGKVECMFPREIWDELPMGMPYYVIKGA